MVIYSMIKARERAEEEAKRKERAEKAAQERARAEKAIQARIDAAGAKGYADGYAKARAEAKAAIAPPPLPPAWPPRNDRPEMTDDRPQEEPIMPRATLDLQNPADLAAVGGQWKCAHGFVPGQPNEGFVSEAAGSPCRLPDYDDSGWDACADLAAWRRRGVSFVWYRIKATLPETVGGRALDGARCLFESCIDDYGEIWINGECDRERATVQGFNVPQRVVVSAEPKPGDEITIAILAMNGPLAGPGGAVFVRYATLAFEWREPGY